MADSRGSHNNHDKNSNDSNRGSHNNHDKNSNDSNRGSHNNHDKNSNDSNRGSHNNHDKNSNDSNQHKLDVATLGNQNINCMGSFMNCRNEITNIICSQVTYCIIGQVSPFLMVNPTSP